MRSIRLLAAPRALVAPAMLALTLLASPAAHAEEAAALAQPLRDAYARGDLADAERRIEADARLVSWSDMRVAVSATFRSRAEGLSLTVRRPQGVEGPLVVAFAPGVWARCTRERRDGSLPQDLLLLRAPVIALAPGQAIGRAVVPVACAAFARQGPSGGETYALRRVAPDSALARLARVLCRGEAPPLQRDPALALAIWIAHEGLSWQRFDRSSFRTFRTPRQWIERSDAPAAGRLLREAGIEPLELPFFRHAPAEVRRDLAPPAEPESPAATS